MSNLWLNIRFGSWHLQCGDNRWYHVRISHNDYHDDPKIRGCSSWKWFEIHQLFGWGKYGG